MIFKSKKKKWMTKRAFFWCRNLTGALYLPNQVNMVDDSAFFGATITGLIISSDCTLVYQSFNACNELDFVYIMEGCSPTIGSEYGTTFQQTKGNLKTLIIPDTVTKIMNVSFYTYNILREDRDCQ